MFSQRCIRPEEVVHIPDDTGLMSYFRKSFNRSTGIETLQVIIPPDDNLLKSVLLHSCHESVGHGKEQRTFDSLSKRVWWPRMSQDVTDFVKACPSCIHRGSNQDRNSKLYAGLSHPHTYKPWQVVSIDIMGPLNTSSNGYKYIILAVDHFTKFVVGTAMKDKEGTSVADFLIQDVIAMFGAPDVILCDNGKELFANSLNQWIADRMGSHITRTANYHPCSNGQVERMNSTLEACLSKSCAYENHKDWDQYVQHCITAYNSGVHRVTGYSPYYLLFGREFNLPIDHILPKPVHHRNPSYVDYTNDLLSKQEDAHFKTLQYSSTSRSLYNKPDHIQDMLKRKDSRREFKYNPDDKVLLWSPIFKHKEHVRKLKCFWVGPYIVVKCINPTTYVLRNCNNSSNKQDRIENVNRMKPYRPPSRWH